MGLGGGLFTVSYIAFLWGWWLPIVPTLLALSSSAIAVTGYTTISADETRRRAILSVIPDLMFHVSADGIYLGQVNSENEIELLYPDFEHIGKHVSQFLPTEISDRQLFYINQAIVTGKCKFMSRKYV